jgi:hypothetical protein
MQVLSLGIPSVDPGTLRWEGDRFAIPSRDVTGVTIRGQLRTEAGRVSRLELFYNEFPYVIEYGYSEPLPLPSVPNRFTVFSLANRHRQARFEFEILSLATAAAAAPEDEFTPVSRSNRISLSGQEHAVHTTVDRTWTSSNGKAFRVMTNGVLIPSL